MPLVSLQDVSLAFQGPPLLESISFQIQARERIGLLGRNGAGKTSLMKLIAGHLEPDDGQVQIHPGVRVGRLSQSVPQGLGGSSLDIVKQGCPPEMQGEPWRAQQAAETILSRMSLDPQATFDALSSGMKRRVLLAQALVGEPDLLLLDEPTNHLDIDSIQWLESFLHKKRQALLFVTHDRAFLRRLATRILEIDRGRLFDWSCDYDQFLKRKQQALAEEEKHNALFDKKLAQEEVWIRQGIKARRTRNEGRVRALEAMRQQRQQRREQVGTSRLQIQEGGKTGRLVLRADSISAAYDDGPPVFQGFSTEILRGDKVGIIGPNGAGKSTLLKTLLGQRSPDAGEVQLGTNLQIAYFDQLREQLDPEKTVAENVGQGGDSVMIDGRKKHLLGYLQDFLFSPQRSRTQVKFLSGGEKNRILLARLFTQPANVIVLDEPTNDLDAETLELLESRLVEFNGTVLVVSHDREFLNHVVTSTIVFEEQGLKEYVGGYDDWQRQRQASADATSADDPPAARPKTPTKAKTERPRRLSYKEKRELEGLPETIESLEAEIASWHEQMAQPEFYQQPSESISAAQESLQGLEAKLAQSYERWEELESLAENG